MGLDMYLTTSKYISGYDNDDQVNKLINLIGLEKSDLQFNGEHGYSVDITVGYWRKANAIHNWFVKNVQDGEDNCEKYYVSHEKLVELRDLCQKQIDNPTEDILIPTAGFFFGSTEKDEWYFNKLKYTVDLINNIITNPRFENFSFYYQSSW